MINRILCTLLGGLLFYNVAFCQQSQKLGDEQILQLYEGLRVADVCDGMDQTGLRDKGILGTEITPLWTDVTTFDHRFCGIAVTARYVPTNKIVENPLPKEKFNEWVGKNYTEITPESYVKFIKEGTVVVLDVRGNKETGSVGSANGLSWYNKGARGIVTNGGIRDIDELVLQRIPVYTDILKRGRGIRPGRNELESIQKPITVAGVLIHPGDIIVADGDGVICVPREYAEKVAQFARKVLDGDKKARKKLYQEGGRKLDKTVQ